MDPQSFDQDALRARRRLFVLTTAALAAGGAALLSSCEQQRGLRRAPGSPPPPSGDPTQSSGTATATTKPTGEQKPTPEPEKAPPPTERPAPPQTEPAIRIKTGSLPKESSRLEVRGPGPSLWIVEPGSGRPGTVAEGPVEFQWTAAGWVVTELAGTPSARRVAVPQKATIDVMPLRGEPQWLSLKSLGSGGGSAAGQYDGGQWPGKLRLAYKPLDLAEPVDIVHEVPMETYLAGVIAKELYNSWGVETHRAQAIAARSYALCEMAMWTGRRHFDVYASERSQAWVGGTKHAKSLDAVASTRGEILLFTGRVVPAYYSSCCGGARASARDAISSSILHDIPPLTVAAGDRRDCCSAAPTYRWQTKYEVADVARTLPAWARAEGFAALLKVDGLRRIDTTARNAAGRPVRFRITDAKGQSFDVPAERMRWAINADPRNPAEMRPSKERVKSAYFEPAILGRELVLTGRGHGHGVGMCQYGAESMAKKGAGATAILARYYPGASVARSYA